VGGVGGEGSSHHSICNKLADPSCLPRRKQFRVMPNRLHKFIFGLKTNSGHRSAIQTRLHYIFRVHSSFHAKRSEDQLIMLSMLDLQKVIENDWAPSVKWELAV